MIPQSDAKSILGKPISGDPTDQYILKYDDATGTMVWVAVGSGPQGPAGSDGADGVDGTNGADGTNGSDGADGVDAWNFRGEWADASTYVANDGVSRGGSSFRCHTGHTATSGDAPVYDPDTDTLTQGGTYWALVAGRGLTGASGADGSDGVDGAAGTVWVWKGAWALSVTYAENEGVENDGSSYIATASHLSDANSEPGTGTSWETYWDVVAAKGDTGEQGAQGEQGDPGASVSWTGAWVTSTAYAVNDGVVAGGFGYVCFSPHTSGASTEPGVGVDWETVWYAVAEGIPGPQGIPGDPGPPGADGAHVIVTGTAGENLAAYDVVYADLADSGKLKKADSDVSTTADAIAITLESISDDATGDVTFGPALLTNGSWSWTPWGNLWLSGTAGQMTQTQPETGYVKPCGFSVTATQIWFFPKLGYDAVAGGASGDVVGPASSTDNAIARYHETTGKILQDSLVTVSDAGTVNIPSGQTYNIDGSAHTHAGTDADVSALENTLIMIAWDVYSEDKAFDDIYIDDLTDQTGIDTVNSTGTYSSGTSLYQSGALTGQTQAISASQVDCSAWADINSATVSQTTPGTRTAGVIHHAVSFDNKVTWKVYKSGNWVDIVRNNGGTWQYSNTGSWTNASSNTQTQAFIQATDQSAYQWSKTNIEAMTDANWNETNGWSSSVTTIDWLTRAVAGTSWVWPPTSTTNELPDMTASNAPSPNVAAADSEVDGSHPAWRAFDQDNNTSWYSGSGAGEHWVSINLGTGNGFVANRWRFRNRYDGDANQPKRFKLQGYNGSSWVDVETSYATADYGKVGANTYSAWFDFNNTTSYEQYRVLVTVSHSGTYAEMAAVEIVKATYETAATPTFTSVTLNYDTDVIALDLRTLGWEASANDPTAGYCVLDVEPVDSISIGTDLKAWLSINDGTNYQEITLESIAYRTVGDHQFVRGDLSGITARTDKTIRLKITTHNSKAVKLHGIGMGVKY